MADHREAVDAFRNRVDDRLEPGRGLWLGEFEGEGWNHRILESFGTVVTFREGMPQSRAAKLLPGRPLSGIILPIGDIKLWRGSDGLRRSILVLGGPPRVAIRRSQ